MGRNTDGWQVVLDLMLKVIGIFAMEQENIS